MDSPDNRQELSTLRVISSTDLDVNLQARASVWQWTGAIMATVNTSGANLNVRAGPGTGYAIISRPVPAERLPVQGRTPDTPGYWFNCQKKV